MNIEAKLISHNRGIMSFETNALELLEVGKEYSLSIKELKDKRSLEQNRLMWELISQIASYNQADEWETYIAGLKKTIPSGYIACLPDEQHKLAGEFRAFEPCGTTYTNKGIKLTTYRVWVGSSKLDKADMTTLIDYFQFWLDNIMRGKENE